MKTCKRNHPLTKSSTLVQYNTRADGTRKASRVCKACKKYRAMRNAKGLKVKDMRRA